jgi:hypothetical protein
MLSTEILSNVKVNIPRWISYLLVLVMPLSVFFPISSPLIAGVFPMYVTIGLYLTDLVILTWLILAVIEQIQQQQSERLLRAISEAMPILLPLALIYLLGGFSLFSAVYTSQTVYTNLRWLSSILMFLLILFSKINVKTLIRVYLLGMVVNVVIGIIQVLIAGPIGLPGELALPVHHPGAAAIPLGDGMMLRAYGMTFNPNILAGFLVVGLLIGLPLVKKWLWRIVWWFLCAGLIATFSRTAIVAFAILVLFEGVWFVIKKKEMRWPVIITLAGMAIGVIGVFLYLDLDPVSTFFYYNTSFNHRMGLAEVAVEIILKNPLTGIGSGNFIGVAKYAPGIRYSDVVHNVPLMLASEVGVLGGLVWVWLWFLPLTFRNGIWNTHRSTNIGFVAAWTAMGIIGLWDFYPWGFESGRLLSIFLLGVIANQMLIIQYKHQEKATHRHGNHR